MDRVKILILIGKNWLQYGVIGYAMDWVGVCLEVSIGSAQKDLSNFNGDRDLFGFRDHMVMRVGHRQCARNKTFCGLRFPQKLSPKSR